MIPPNFDDLQVAYDLDQNLLRAAETHQLIGPFLRRKRILISVAILVQLTAILITIVLGRVFSWTMTEFGCGISLLLMGWLLWEIWRRGFRLHGDPTSRPRQFLRLTPEGIGSESENGWTFRHWSDISSVTESDEYLFLVTRNQALLLIPKLSIPTTFAATFIETIKHFAANPPELLGLPDFVTHRMSPLNPPVVAIEFALSPAELNRLRSLPFIKNRPTDSDESKSAPVVITGWQVIVLAFLLSIPLIAAHGFFRGAIIPSLATGMAIWSITIVQERQPKPSKEAEKIAYRLFIAGILIERPTVWEFGLWNRFLRIAVNDQAIGLFTSQFYVNPIPKSAFADTAAADEFVARAKSLHRDYCDRHAEAALRTAAAIPTDLSNPYAPPKTDCRLRE